MTEKLYGPRNIPEADKSAGITKEVKGRVSSRTSLVFSQTPSSTASGIDWKAIQRKWQDGPQTQEEIEAHLGRS